MAVPPNPQRTKVLWIGESVPEPIRAEIGRWGMAIAAVTLDNMASQEPGLRAVLLPYTADQRFMRKALAQLRPMLDTGATIAIVLASEAEHGEGNRLTSDFIGCRQVNGTPPHDVAGLCAYHNPGRPVNRSLRVDGGFEPANSAYSTLIERAFGDFQRIELQQLTGGRSRAGGVWRVYAFDSKNHMCESFVVKAGPKRPITQEIDTTMAHVMDYVPFPHVPPLVIDRCVEGADSRLIVSRFVDRATRFDEYLLFGAPGLAIAGLFDGPLRTWRMNVQLQSTNLAVEYTRFNVLPKKEQLEDLEIPYHEALSRSSSLAGPAQLLDILERLPSFPVRACQGHGDLHVRNLFVRRNSHDVVLIDFASARYIGPSSRDPASLDVSIAFDVADREGGYMEEQDMRVIYMSPLLPPVMPTGQDSRWEALLQLRRHVAGEGVSSAEYEVSVACHLLRFARFASVSRPNDAMAEGRRALAYELAANLITPKSSRLV